MPSEEDYWVGPTIGEGAFGHVVYAVHKATERKVAIKVMEVPTREGSHHRQNQQKQKTAIILNERRILSLPELKSSRWTIDLWAAFCGKASSSSSSQCLYFVLKLATGGDLAGLIRRGLQSHHRRSWLHDSVPWYASQLIEAVEFLHSKGVLHCDLKPENLLLDATNGHLLIADFGCAIDTNQQHHQPIEEPCHRGTALYASPEVLRAGSLSVAVDYWSVGCILHAMIHGSSPFDHGSEALTVRAILRYSACDGSRSSWEEGDNTEFCVASSDEIKADNHFEDTASEKAFPSIKNEENHGQNLMKHLSRDLLVAVPEERISAWKESALSFLSLKSHDDEGNCDNDDVDPSSRNDIKNILLPIPDWQDEIDGATLRDGSLGWFVFQI